MTVAPAKKTGLVSLWQRMLGDPFSRELIVIGFGGKGWDSHDKGAKIAKIRFSGLNCAYLCRYKPPDMTWKQHIPNTFTTLNLISGLVAITLIVSGNLTMAAFLVFVSALFDLLDGLFARLLDARSELGRQLDSLADLVSFGVVPGLLMFQLISAGCEGSCNILERLNITPYFALLIPVCAAFRLAKFNIDLRQEKNFIGLPTPANAIFFASIPLILLLPWGHLTVIPSGFFTELFSNTRILAILAVAISYLMISDFRMFSLKFKNMSWKANKPRYLLLILILPLLMLFGFSAIPLIILASFLLSLAYQSKPMEG